MDTELSVAKLQYKLGFSMKKKGKLIFKRVFENFFKINI